MDHHRISNKPCQVRHNSYLANNAKWWDSLFNHKDSGAVDVVSLRQRLCPLRTYLPYLPHLLSFNWSLYRTLLNDIWFQGPIQFVELKWPQVVRLEARIDQLTIPVPLPTFPDRAFQAWQSFHGTGILLNNFQFKLWWWWWCDMSTLFTSFFSCTFNRSGVMWFRWIDLILLLENISSLLNIMMIIVGRLG